MIKIRYVAVIASLMAASAQAGIVVQLGNSSQTGAPGDTLMFSVTLMNPSGTDAVFLNGASSTASSPYLDIDVTPFFNNAPLSLDPLASSGSFELFDVTIALNALDGPYVDSTVSIQGGADGSTFDDLADISFDVIVQSSAVPEPRTFSLLAWGLTGLFCARRFLRGRSSSHSPFIR